MRNALPFFAVLVLLHAPAAAEIPDYPDEEVAGIPVNYTESEVGDFELPPLLELADGSPVEEVATWREQRRPEILDLLRTHQFGRSPGRPEAMHFEVTDEGTLALDGAALRKRVTVFFSEDRGAEAPQMELLIYLPTGSEDPVPVLLHIGFFGNSQMVDDPELEPSRIWGRDRQRTAASGPSPFGTLPVRQFLDAGFGFALVYYGDLEPDFNGGFELGVRNHFLEAGRESPAADEWGSVAAWAWGMSRAMDYFETDDSADHERVAINGASRLGKTAVWAMAEDQRFALLLSSVAGEGGTALSRRDYGETIAHLVHPDRFPYWYCDNYDKLAADPKSAPIDGHMVLALAAPRPVLLQTGRTDKWSDPMGEWLAGKAASPVWELFGESNLSGYDEPPTAEPILNTLGWYMHEGGHGVTPDDWTVFVEFMEEHLR